MYIAVPYNNSVPAYMRNIGQVLVNDKYIHKCIHTYMWAYVKRTLYLIN
jgi:hypothetical protein